ncbi:5488_t:CDS:2, partial [Racocetra persica]
IFIDGLKDKIAAFISIAKSKTLNDTIENARKIEAREYYKKRKREDPTNQLIKPELKSIPCSKQNRLSQPGRPQTVVLSTIIVEKETKENQPEMPFEFSNEKNGFFDNYKKEEMKE